MRQVKSQAIRTGVNQEWGGSVLAPIADVCRTERAAELYVQHVLKSVSRYPVSFEFTQTVAVGSTVASVFYKYIQRGRYRRQALHRARTGGLRARSLPEKTLLAQSYALSHARLMAARTVICRLVGPSTTVEIRNVYALLGAPMRLDLMAVQHYYTFNRYRNLMYLLDAIQGVQLTTRLGCVALLGDVVSKGLIRNRRKGQRRFVRLLEAVVNHAREKAYVQYRPDGWRIELYGKLDGQLRAKRHLLTFGHVSYQKLPLGLNYTQRSVDTKFGAFGLKMWVRLPEDATLEPSLLRRQASSGQPKLSEGHRKRAFVARRTLKWAPPRGRVPRPVVPTRRPARRR